MVMRTSFLRYGQKGTKAYSRHMCSRWRKLRKAAHEGLGPRVAEQYQALQQREAVILARDMITDPLRWEDHIKRYDSKSA